MNLYSRDELTAFTKSIADLNRKLSELDKDIKGIDTELKTEGNDANIANMKKVRLNKVLEKEEIVLQIKNIKKKISATTT